MTISNITLCYFDWGTKGRGEFIKLLLEDAAICHEYKRVEVKEKWQAHKEELIQEGNAPACVPYVQIDGGKKYFGTAAILRLLSKKLGKYISNGEEEEQFLDACSDFASDWYSAAVKMIIKPDEKAIAEEYWNIHAPKHFARFERLYSSKEGPYLLGPEITYVDFMVYHTLEEQHRTKDLKEFPGLAAFVKEFEARPNVSKYLASLK